MNRLPYYKAYPRDFCESTVGMTLESKGAFRLVIDLIYMHSGRLPDDARFIAGQLGCSTRKWNSIRGDLIEAKKLQVDGEFLTNNRVNVELQTLAKLQEKQSENARTPRKNKYLGKPWVGQTEPEPEPKPETRRGHVSYHTDPGVRRLQEPVTIDLTLIEGEKFNDHPS